MRTQIHKDIRDFMKQSFYITVDLADDASLLDTGTMDSTGVLEVITFIEQQFGIRVGDGEITPGNFDSMQRITAFVERKLILERGQREGVIRTQEAQGAPEP